MMSEKKRIKLIVIGFLCALPIYSQIDYTSNGGTVVGDLSSRSYLKIKSLQWPELRFQTPTSDETMKIGLAHASFGDFNISEGDFYVYSSFIDAMPIIVRKNGDVLLNPSNGKTGIGLTSPDADLHIKSAKANLFIENTDPDSWSYLRIQGSGANFWDIAQFGNNDYLEFKPKGLDSGRIIFKTNGNVAINGKLEAKEIKVQSAPTADFVFEEDYKLKEIAKVEAFIKENKHLPDFPSAKEIERNGVNLGEMDAKLLQKIEELTLYTIEQQKQLDEQMQIIEYLKNEINQIKE